MTVASDMIGEIATLENFYDFIAPLGVPRNKKQANIQVFQPQALGDFDQQFFFPGPGGDAGDDDRFLFKTKFFDPVFPFSSSSLGESNGIDF